MDILSSSNCTYVLEKYDVTCILFLLFHYPYRLGMKHLEFQFNPNSCCWCDTYTIMYLCKESGFASICCLLHLDIFCARLSVFTVEGSSWFVSKAYI
jgi:hypothetical protein